MSDLRANLTNYFAGHNTFRNHSINRKFGIDYRRFGIAYHTGSGYYTVDTEDYGAPVRDAAGSVMYRTDPGDAIEWVRAQNEWNDTH
jgi:hypothetical protein